jgi:hypothetical protein
MVAAGVLVKMTGGRGVLTACTDLYTNNEVFRIRSFIVLEMLTAVPSL